MLRKVAGVVVLIAIVSFPLALLYSRSSPGTRGVAVLELIGPMSDTTDAALRSGQGVRPLLERLAEARERDDVGAVVIRINSGGGTAASAQEVHRAISKVREAGKPVVVSMGDTAASGAYYAATAADRILASPATVTGSIGVLFQYLNASELAERYGVELTTVKSGPNKGVGNPTQALSPEQRQILQGVVDNSLEQFIGAIVAGRGLDADVVRPVADGRIFTGEQAKALGLIDDFGDLEDAVNLAADLAGIAGKPKVVVYRDRAPWLARYFDLGLGIIQGAPLIDAFGRLESDLLPGLAEGRTEMRLLY